MANRPTKLEILEMDLEALFINGIREPIRMGKVGMGKTRTPYSKRKDQCEKWVQSWSKKECQGCEHRQRHQ